MNRLPDFGKDLERGFEAHENCYDCATFYVGCQGWRASSGFDCRDFNRLPDVGIDGRHGQELPPSRRRVLARPETGPIEQAPPESNRQTTPCQSHADPPVIHRPPTDPPSSLPDTPANPKARICGCGAILPKGKRLCDTCRIESRRQTKRQYMRSYMGQRRSLTSGSDSGVPFTPESTHATCPGGGDLRASGHWGRGCRS